MVEDDEAVRELVEELLSEAGYDIETGGEGEEGLRLYRGEGPFDLVLTDMIMPGMTGADLAARIREVTPDQKIMYMTGYSKQSGLFPRDVDPGVPLLKKPFRAEELLRMVGEEMQTDRT